MSDTKKQKKDRDQERAEVATLTRSVRLVPLTEDDRERKRRESEVFFKARGEAMRGGRS